MSKETGNGREVRAWIPPLAVEADAAEQVVLVGGHHLVADHAPAALVRAHAVAVRALVDHLARGRERGRLREARKEGGAEVAARGAKAAVDVEERVASCVGPFRSRVVRRGRPGAQPDRAVGWRRGRVGRQRRHVGRRRLRRRRWTRGRREIVLQIVKRIGLNLPRRKGSVAREACKGVGWVWDFGRAPSSAPSHILCDCRRPLCTADR